MAKAKQSAQKATKNDAASSFCRSTIVTLSIPIIFIALYTQLSQAIRSLSVVPEYVDMPAIDLKAITRESIQETSIPQSPPLRQRIRKQNISIPQSSNANRETEQDKQQIYNNNSSTTDYSLQASIPTTALGVIQEYIRQHSVDAIRANPDGRRYAIGNYRCPTQAGNQLHNFFNHFLWSILTNRTLLWQYNDDEICQKGVMYIGQQACKDHYEVSDCDAILKRASWIPSYDEWKEELQLPEPVEILPDWWSTHDPFQQHDTDLNAHRIAQDEVFQHYNKKVFYKAQLVRFPMLILRLKGFKFAAKLDPWLQTKYAHYVERVLYNDDNTMSKKDHAHGNNSFYLYGLLFHHSFRIRDDIISPNQPTVDPTAFSLAIHSRHMWPTDDGSNIIREQKCLNKLLKLRRPDMLDLDSNHTSTAFTDFVASFSKPKCQVVILSDRVKTLESLSTWLKSEHGCEALIADHTIGSSFSTEHGPFAGAGFFQDLHLASQTRHGVVGVKLRSSTDLVVEMVEVNRRILVRENNKVFGDFELDDEAAHDLSHVPVCFMPEPPQPKK